VFKRYPVSSLVRTTAIAAAAFLLLALPEGGSALAQEKLTVRLDFVPWGVHAAMHLAQDRGWFEEAGLEIEVQDGRGSNNTLQLVNAGQVEVGQIQLGLLPLARQEGAELISFAGWLRRTDLCVLVDRGSGLRVIEDLRGKSLVVFAASPWAPFIDAFLAAGGLDRNDTEVLFVDPAALWGTYTSGRADGLMSTLTSAVPVAEKSRPSDTILLSEADIIFPSYGLVAREETLANRRDALANLDHS
jgi:NitT/TauT family transport system substrate-binding protein